MTIRVFTKPLLAILGDLALTVLPKEAGAMGCVLLHTSRGGYGEEPGEQDLLAGISTSGYAAGHTYTPCIGQIPMPMLWPARDIKNVISVFKPCAKDEAHAVDISVDGGTITVAEDQTLFGDAVSLSFGQGTIANFPGSVYRMLELQPPRGSKNGDKPERVLPRTDVTAANLEPFVKVAARRGELIQLYRAHQSRRVLVQVGPHYRGAVVPAGYDAAGAEDVPDVEVHAPDAELLAELTGRDKGSVPAQRDSSDDDAAQLLIPDAEPAGAS